MKNQVYVIAEAGVNHNGSLEMAKKLIDAAVEAGSDAVKFQTFKTENLVSRSAPKANYQKETTSESELQFDMLKKLELDESAHEELIGYCKKRDIEFLSTPFDFDSLDLLTNKFEISKMKIPSGEITNAPFLLKIAQTLKPIILSTGMSTLGEIEQALGVIAFGYLNGDEAPSLVKFQEAYYSKEGQEAIKKNVIILHCTTEYPTKYEDVNLETMNTLKSAFGLQIGYSDHTLGIVVPIAAVARGAVVIEKHFTLDRKLPGPDHQASLEPAELKEMVTAIRQIEKAIGNSIKSPTQVELKNKDVIRKSIIASKEIKIGENFSRDNIVIKRPGTGISPMFYWDMIGRKSDKNFKEDEVVR
jgi:N-acetylneuraminate synthase